MIGPLESLLWLTLNIYHEARGEERIGQIAVAHVAINRAEETGKGIKYVVLDEKQFSWTHQKDDWFPYEGAALLQCLESAFIAAQGFDFTGGATYYHHKRIRPRWTKNMKQIGQYGSHKFYVRNEK